MDKVILCHCVQSLCLIKVCGLMPGLLKGKQELRLRDHTNFRVLVQKARGSSAHVPVVIETGRQPLGNSHQHQVRGTAILLPSEKFGCKWAECSAVFVKSHWAWWDTVIVRVSKAVLVRRQCAFEGAVGTSCHGYQEAEGNPRDHLGVRKQKL